MLEAGAATLVDGRAFAPEEIYEGQKLTLISKQFAERNALKVGDRLVVTHYPTLQLDPDYIAGKIDLSFEVIGIYQDNELPDLDSALNTNRSIGDKFDELWFTKMRVNTFWVPNQVLIELAAESKAMLLAKGVPEKIQGWATFDADSPMFILHSPDDVEDFIIKFSPLFEEGTKLYANQEIWDQIKLPLQQTQKMADSILMYSVAGAIIIIGLTVLLFIRDRKQELGILMALGELKQKIVMQIVLEVLLIAIIGVILSLFSGQLLAAQISEAMIQDQLVADIDLASNEEYLSTRKAMQQYTSDVSPQEVADNYQITFSGRYIGLFLLIYLGTSLVATAMPTWYIVRLQPKQVLMT